MKQAFSKEKKFMSSKSIYFLPLIKNIKPNISKPKNSDKSAPMQHRCIEDIIQNNPNVPTKAQFSGQVVILTKDRSSYDNLYNKYEYLPKIYLKKNRKNSQRSHQISDKSPPAKPKIQQSFRNAVLNVETEIDNSKQNVSNFNNFFYKDHFNRRLEAEISKIQFKLNYNYSGKTLMLSCRQEDQIEENCNKPKLKYTKLNFNKNEGSVKQKQLQKVPQFLMRILDPLKPSATNLRHSHTAVLSDNY